LKRFPGAPEQGFGPPAVPGAGAFAIRRSELAVSIMLLAVVGLVLIGGIVAAILVSGKR
jgi:hypothetical protein